VVCKVSTPVFHKYLDFIYNKKEIIICAVLQELSAGEVPET
jgi:hypothetical protein